MSKLDKIEELQNIIKEDSSNFQARRKLAVLLMDSGFNEEALGHLLYLSKNFSNDDGIFYNLGIVYEKLKKFANAKEAYLKSLEISPDSMDSTYNLGLVYIELKEYDKAIECFEKILKDDNEDSNSYFNLGLIYFKTKNYIKAMENFQTTIDLNDEDIYAHFYIGNIFKELGDLDSAREKFNKVLELSPDYSWAYFNLAVIDNETGNIEGAIENLQKTIELNPYDLDAYKILIKILLKEQNFEEAAAIGANAVSQCEENGDLDYLTYLAYFKNGENENAKEYLEHAIRNFKTLSVPLTKAKHELSHIK